MRKLNRTTYRALAKQPDYTEPRSNDEKRINPKPVVRGNTHGDMQSVSLQTMAEELTDIIGTRAILGNKLGQIELRSGVMIAENALIVGISPIKVCKVCNIAVPDAHFVAIWSDGDELLNLLMEDDTLHWTVYHMECEPTDPEYKFKVEHGTIHRLVRNGGENSWQKPSPSKPS